MNLKYYTMTILYYAIFSIVKIKRMLGLTFALIYKTRQPYLMLFAEQAPIYAYYGVHVGINHVLFYTYSVFSTSSASYIPNTYLIS